MKKILATSLLCLSTALFLPGCVLGLSFGGGQKNNSTNSTRSTSNNSQPSVGQQMLQPTLGQQLIDLQKARDAGAISDAEYQSAKAKLLGEQQP